MDNNFNGDLDDESVLDILKFLLCLKFWIKLVDEFVVYLEE